MKAINKISWEYPLRGPWHCALLVAVILMAGKTNAGAQNLGASGVSASESLARVKHILVAPGDTLLSIDWEEAPQAQNNGIYGSVVAKTLDAPQQD